MHHHCGTNNRAPRWTFTDPCKPEVRPGAREESASPAWLAARTMNETQRCTQRKCIWRFDTGCGPTLYRKWHSHNTPGKRHNDTWVEPLAGNCTTSSTSTKWMKYKVLQDLTYWAAIIYIYDFVLMHYRSRFSVVTLRQLLKELCLILSLEYSTQFSALFSYML